MEAVDKLQDEMLAAIASRGSVRNYPAHAVLVHEGDQSDAFYILLAGRVKVYGAADDGREVIYNTLGPGEYFGEMSLDGGPRSASVASLEPLRCVLVRGAEMRDFLALHPDFALHLIHRLTALLRRATDKVKSLALDDVYQRVARLLDELAEAGESGEGGPRRLTLKLTQQDIAERVGASREMVSRVFKQLLLGGYVEQRDGLLVLLKKLPAGW